VKLWQVITQITEEEPIFAPLVFSHFQNGCARCVRYRGRHKEVLGFDMFLMRWAKQIVYIKVGDSMPVQLQYSPRNILRTKSL
jgi:hypothetical protein